MSDEKNSKYLAIMFFNQNYRRQSELKGVWRDTSDDVEDVLKELQFIVSKRIGEEFERVHFHFSGKVNTFVS